MTRRALLITLVAALVIGNMLVVYVALTAPADIMIWDFHPLWTAGRWILQGQGSPYSAEMALDIQMQSYGHPAADGDDSRAFAYPPYILLLLIPSIFLPLAWAEAVWLTVLEASVVFLVLGTIHLSRTKPSTLLKATMALWAFLLYPVTWALLLGQVSILISALVVAALIALQKEREIIAGALLALTTAKPQMTFLLVPALLVWALTMKRHRFLLAFGGSMAALLTASFIVVPSWLVEMWQTGINYFQVQPFSPPVGLLGTALGGSETAGVVLTLLLTAFMILGLSGFWWHQRDTRPLPLTAIGLTLTVTTLIAPRTSIVNQTALVIPLILIMLHVSRKVSWGHLLSIACQTILGLGLWVLDVLLRSSAQASNLAHLHLQHRIISPILPTLTLIALAAYAWQARRKQEEVV